MEAILAFLVDESRNPPPEARSITIVGALFACTTTFRQVAKASFRHCLAALNALRFVNMRTAIFGFIFIIAMLFTRFFLQYQRDVYSYPLFVLASRARLTV